MTEKIKLKKWTSTSGGKIPVGALVKSAQYPWNLIIHHPEDDHLTLTSHGVSDLDFPMVVLANQKAGPGSDSPGFVVLTARGRVGHLKCIFPDDSILLELA